jgi:hypothetical protein
VQTAAAVVTAACEPVVRASTEHALCIAAIVKRDRELISVSAAEGSAKLSQYKSTTRSAMQCSQRLTSAQCLPIVTYATDCSVLI